MNGDFKIWEIDEFSKAAVPVASATRMATENSLEEVLVRNPDMLAPGLKLVGRQTPIDGGYLDLLGVNEDGKLVVYELKREKLSRDAVAQVIDYCSFLESLAEAELAAYIANHSGNHGIEKIDDFESWYGDRQGKQLISLRPTRMVLVGFAADTRAHRMVEFLQRSGVDISLLTFHGYRLGNKTLLAKQVQRGVETQGVTSRARLSDSERRRVHAERAAELGMENLWEDAVDNLATTSYSQATGVGITFYQPKITLPDYANVAGSHSVVIDQRGMLRVTFYPAAVHVCLEKFQKFKETIPFQFEKPPNAPTTKLVSEQWYCLLDEEKWNLHKGALCALANDVHDAWMEIRRSGNTGAENGA